jgi:hypothetical protein
MSRATRSSSMADGMFATERLVALRGAAVGRGTDEDLRAASEREHRREYGTIVVVGGGCYGSYYVRQLARAREAGALRWRELVVVDRDTACRVAVESSGAPSLGIRLAVGEWSDFFDQYLAAAADDPAESYLDAIVPSPLMPHLAFDWLERRARARWPGRRIERLPLEHAPEVPWQRQGADGTHYVSFAEWMCPINCIEPALCPATKGPRTWSMPPAVRAYVENELANGVTLRGPLLFHCTHRAYGVGMFDSADLLAADALIAAETKADATQFLIGTVSHCHGALGRLSIGA